MRIGDKTQMVRWYSDTAAVPVRGMEYVFHIHRLKAMGFFPRDLKPDGESAFIKGALRICKRRMVDERLKEVPCSLLMV